MQYTMIQQQRAELERQMQAIEEAIFEINESRKGLKEVSDEASGKEILVPIVSGIFAKAELKNVKEFIVNIGANTAVAKSSEEVQTLLETQSKKMQETQHHFVDNLQKLTMQAKELESELMALQEK